VSQILVDKSICKKDGICVAVCPARTIALDEEGYPEEIGAVCYQCGHCVAICSSHALTHTGLPIGGMLPVAQEQPSAEVVDNLLMSRRSIREFRDRPIERQTLEAILDVARWAPTASNDQNLRWIVLNGRERVHELACECVRQMKNMRPMTTLFQGVISAWEKGIDGTLRGATAVVAVCAPQESTCGQSDAAIALTHVELAAVARGLGMTWAGILMHVAAASEPLRQWLQVPEGYTLSAAVMLGYGKYKYHRIPPRKPLSARWM
jgi:nitroreductase/NAD-dependent dihydropyrimidine dehydrogenase PreA subunit